MGVKRQGQIYLQSVYGLLRELLHQIFDQWCSYLAQLLRMVCKLQSTLHITAMALESKVY